MGNFTHNVIVDLSVHRQCCVPVYVRDWLKNNWWLQSPNLAWFEKWFHRQIPWVRNWIDFFHLSSRKKTIDGESLMGKVAVAEASDAIPVRTPVPEKLGKAEEIRSSEMTISSAISDRISQNHSRNQIQQWTMRVTPSPEKLSPQLTIGLRISSKKSKNSTHLWKIILFVQL